MTSYLPWMTFWLIVSKHCITDRGNVWTTKETMLKNKPHLVSFHRSIFISLWTFPPTFVYIYIYIYIERERERKRKRERERLLCSIWWWYFWCMKLLVLERTWRREESISFRFFHSLLVSVWAISGNSSKEWRLHCHMDCPRLKASNYTAIYKYWVNNGFIFYRDKWRLTVQAGIWSLYTISKLVNNNIF